MVDRMSYGVSCWATEGQWDSGSSPRRNSGRVDFRSGCQSSDLSRACLKRRRMMVLGLTLTWTGGDGCAGRPWVGRASRGTAVELLHGIASVFATEGQASAVATARS